MAEEQDIKISKYNSGIAIIMRLDSLWKDVHKHSRTGFFYKWNQDLDRIWCELARDLTETEYTTKKEKFDEFDTKLAESGDIKDTKTSDFEDANPDDIENRKKHYKILMEKELFLRRLENEVGKGTAWAEEEEDWE